MMSVPDKIITWQMVRPASIHPETGATIPENLELAEIPVPGLDSGEVLVAVAGCGIRHMDSGIPGDGTATGPPSPLTLGHDISGRVVAGDAPWIGKEVFIPAVMPCGKCHLCETGHGNHCVSQKMPGNGVGVFRGFASHIRVSSRDIFEIKNRRGYIPLEHLAVAGDAVAPLYQAARHGSLTPGDNVIVLGFGGRGQRMAQTARALGAGTVMAVDTVGVRLEKRSKNATDVVVNAAGMDPGEVAAHVKEICARRDLPGDGWKIFETTCGGLGREIAMNLLDDAEKIIITGSEMEKVKEDLSRLPAFEKKIVGSRGCIPEYYPRVLELVAGGGIAVSPFVITRPMSWIREVFAEARRATPARRIVLTTDDFGLDDSPEPKSCR